MKNNKSIHKVLIANRGEIAVRVIRACQELGIKTVAVYSKADRDSLHTRLADESICIGPGPSAKSYLSIPSIMAAAEISGADAIHPGYGFLSENSKFAEICEKSGVTFIGPSPTTIRMLGNKVEARRLATEADVPLLPGSKDKISDYQDAEVLAKQIGFPLIIKAAAGGGGRGMKIVTEMSQLQRQYDMARSEAEVAFGDSDVFIERYLTNPRHVEVQVIGDMHGNVVALGERDCSVQRRHQKLVEESPCPVFNPKLREAIQDVAVRLVKVANYHSAGTVEFLYDQDRQEFYFMEVNTRIQVEHPVTEMVTGVDLIKTMIKVARGEKLPFQQKDIRLTGHAMECRINAEDPESFAPWPGKISAYHAPGGPGVRIDGMIYAGFAVPSLYDSMIAKLICYGEDRAECLARMKRALSEMKVDGIRTNISFHQKLVAHKDFAAGKATTRFLEIWQK